MAMDALNACAATAINNTATLLNTIGNGAKVWIQKSDLMWTATTATYYVTLLATDNKLIEGICPTQAAKIVALALSIYGFVQGVFAQGGEKAVDMTALPNKNLIMITNTAALALCGSRHLGLGLTALQAIVVTVVSYIVVRIFHPLMVKAVG